MWMTTSDQQGKKEIIRHGIFPSSDYSSSEMDCLLPHLFRCWRLSLIFLWTTEKSSRRMKISLLMRCCYSFFLVNLLCWKNGIDPAASNRTHNGLVVALLPCAVGISCWSGTPGDPKGATPGCWKISPWRPTSIRGLLA